MVVNRTPAPVNKYTSMIANMSQSELQATYSNPAIFYRRLLVGLGHKEAEGEEFMLIPMAQKLVNNG